jgi:hypothetical protein
MSGAVSKKPRGSHDVGQPALKGPMDSLSTAAAAAAAAAARSVCQNWHLAVSTFAAAGAAGLMTAPQGFCTSPALLHTPGLLGELQAGILLGSSCRTPTLQVSGTTW